MNELSTEELQNAIKEGTREAVWDAINNATQTPTADFFDSVKDGIKDSLDTAVEYISAEEIKSAITEYLEQSIQINFTSEFIGQAITEGIKQGIITLFKNENIGIHPIGDGITYGIKKAFENIDIKDILKQYKPK